MDVTGVLDPARKMSIRHVLGSHEGRLKYSFMKGDTLHGISLDDTFNLVGSRIDKIWDAHTVKTNFNITTGSLGVQWHMDFGDTTFKASLINLTGGHPKLIGKCTWFFSIRLTD
ncbi:outer envelope pore protein 24 [Carex littledalei]|uniref:Outer envelope pore protein 24 n=1 Tax=Carex littledalei TaxID=544730 RepID=A0A833R6U9_9POAL|nr:outer envelope pore protein 24 [Carex littledalei]